MPGPPVRGRSPLSRAALVRFRAMPDTAAATPPNPVTQALLATMDDRHGDMAALLGGLPAGALDWSPAADANSLAGLARHILDIEGHVAGDLAGGDSSWTGANGTQVDAPANADLLTELLQQSGRALNALLGEVSARDSARLMVVLEEFDHCAMHHGQMQLTRHLWEAAHPGVASRYEHWR